MVKQELAKVDLEDVVAATRWDQLALRRFASGAMVSVIRRKSMGMVQLIAVKQDGTRAPTIEQQCEWYL
ncbi:hypothetical protein TAO_0258 [Candidatus Nitrosoglobus terrae]|uniref:Uncharacterized protein n=1 Tax=Candidatus Nitrosoglobus terrae TaxID=1630141 RepID=A0A1Q2SKH6_9GAMM|nr:hypothetical protein TAO_0258 [Candidatus Nitrosoglobus terrae]